VGGGEISKKKKRRREREIDGTQKSRKENTLIRRFLPGRGGGGG